MRVSMSLCCLKGKENLRAFSSDFEADVLLPAFLLTTPDTPEHTAVLLPSVRKL